MKNKKIINEKTIRLTVRYYDDGTSEIEQHPYNLCGIELIGLCEFLRVHALHTSVENSINADTNP